MSVNDAATARPDWAWLDVSPSEKNEAKTAHALWDPAAKGRFDLTSRANAVWLWAASPDVHELLPGEDRKFGSGVFVDVVSQTCWFMNVCTRVSVRDAKRLRIEHSERRWSLDLRTLDYADVVPLKPEPQKRSAYAAERTLADYQAAKAGCTDHPVEGKS